MVSDTEDCSYKLFVGLYLFHVIRAKSAFLIPFPATQRFFAVRVVSVMLAFEVYIQRWPNYTANRGLVVEIFHSASDLHRIKDVSVTEHREEFLHVKANSASVLTYTTQ
jgi:hypothetical protein